MEGEVGKYKIMALDKETRRAIINYIVYEHITPLIRRNTEDIDLLKLRGWDNRNNKEVVAEIEGQLFALDHWGTQVLKNLQSAIIDDLSREDADNGQDSQSRV